MPLCNGFIQEILNIFSCSGGYNRPYQAVDRTAKILAVAAFFLTLCIVWKVRRLRVRLLLARSPGEAAHVPSNDKVFVYCSSAHLALFVVVLTLNSSCDATVEQHIGLMQDMLLLPQVIGNAAWRVNCKPLRGASTSASPSRACSRACMTSCDHVRWRVPIVLALPPNTLAADALLFSHGSDLAAATVEPSCEAWSGCRIGERMWGCRAGRRTAPRLDLAGHTVLG
ncbi:Os02g0460000 [Oryza sativa Japonica Group]|uniref:RING-type E3 ubiquitin transferase n=1 Tax=Oryza sativa subsp. japonica TaxID=39947 RepID=A0A0P0VIT7_ORYSJ|nr:Os02g0460000 [Oryza sativa Japonica Group]